VAAGKQQAFKAEVSGGVASGFEWAVEGVVGGNSIWGTISQTGIYTAPAINPGKIVFVSATSTSNSNLVGNAAVTVVNPPAPTLSGATYANELASWVAVISPSVQDRSGLAWDDSTRSWGPAPNWTLPANGIGVQIYDLEPFLRPATRLAIARNDVALMEQLAAFHMAMLQWRSTLPAFTNFSDGWNGWFDVGDPSLADGYPPEQYCKATQSPINCLTAGAVQGWGQLAFANPNLATLMQDLVNLAYDDSSATQAFKDQHYTYVGPYNVQGDQYPWLMIYVVGDSAERLP
jgi:hypothetical protein